MQSGFSWLPFLNSLLSAVWFFYVCTGSAQCLLTLVCLALRRGPKDEKDAANCPDGDYSVKGKIMLSVAPYTMNVLLINPPVHLPSAEGKETN